ncbi:MAG: hypothetical protein BRD30_10820, partial [Bacteroidetes bacterium QH_2_63_10]
TLDVGAVSAPALVDLDDDGDRDLVVGNNQEPGATSARLHHFENVGTSTTPVFERRPAPLLPDAESGFNFVPAFSDVDADGDPDLFLGTFSGTVRFYRNTGTAESPQFEREPSGDVELPQGNFATPALVDIDADGDQDLFLGSSSAEGTVSFYRNEGTPETPDFTLAAETYSDIRAGESRTHPAFADRNGDGAPELYLGTSVGLKVYENTGTPQSAAFESAPDSLARPFRPLVAPALGDVDGDRRLDLMTGGEGGGVKFFARQEASGSVREPDPPYLRPRRGRPRLPAGVRPARPSGVRPRGPAARRRATHRSISGGRAGKRNVPLRAERRRADPRPRTNHPHPLATWSRESTLKIRASENPERTPVILSLTQDLFEVRHCFPRKDSASRCGMTS